MTGGELAPKGATPWRASRQIALAAGLLHQLLQFRHRLFDSPVMRLFVPDGSDPLDVARAYADIGDVRPLRFQELIDVILQRLDGRGRGQGKQLYPHCLPPSGPGGSIRRSSSRSRRRDLKA